MNRQRHLSHWLLASFQPFPGKPAIAYGLRAALGMSVPIGLGLITGQLATGLLGSLAVFNVLYVEQAMIETVLSASAVRKVGSSLSATLIR